MSNTVLIVDDSLTSMMQVRTILNNDGRLTVYQANDLEGALKAISEVSIDIVILDYNMPAMNGVEMAERLMVEIGTAKFVLLTADANNFVVNEAMEAGFSSVLEKPFSGDKLTQILEQLTPTPVSDLQRSALEEVAKIAVARAAKQFSQVVDDYVEFELTNIVVVPVDAIEETLKPTVPEGSLSVCQEIFGALEGRSHLILSKSEGNSHIEAMLGTAIEVDESNFELLEHDSVKEMANIIVSSAIRTMSYLIHERVNLGLPSIESGDGGDTFSPEFISNNYHVILLETTLHTKKTGITAVLLFTLTLPSLRKLVEQILPRSKKRRATDIFSGS